MNKNIKETVLYKRKKITKSELAEQVGISLKNLSQRLRRGWTVKEAAEIPLGEKRPVSKKKKTTAVSKTN